MPLIVTLVIITVAGFTARLGVSTASRLVWPSLCRARALAKAAPTGPSFEPINRSMWAISLPSPARASPMNMDIRWYSHAEESELERQAGGAAVPSTPVPAQRPPG